MRQSEGPSSSSHQRSLFQNSNQDRLRREEATLLQMEQVTTKYLLKMQESSSFFRDDTENNSIPRFQPSEIVLETTIGMGEFGIVLKVGNISLNEEHKSDEADQVLRQQLARSYKRIVSNESIDTSTTSLTGSNDCETSSSAMELAPTSIRDTPANALLVIKQIRKDLYPKKRIEAAKDLAREAKLLARLQHLYALEGTDQSRLPSNHPNIISIRGIVSSPGTPLFGILLDRLHLTLTELSSAWKTRQENIVETLSKRRRKHSGASTLLSIARIIPDQVVGTIYGVSQTVGTIWNGDEKDSNRKPSNEGVDDDEQFAMANLASPEALLLLGERILAVWDVSEGMGYLHHHKILYRDLKTENIARTVPLPSNGENVRNGLVEFDHKTQQRMQIFDFGLAKDCKPTDRISVDTNSFYDNYKMTGMTGTMRIMAPEVIQCKSYGLPADVYSFGICLWEVFTGTKCNFLSAAEICDTKQTVRPKLPTVFDPATEDGSVGMPKALQELMQACWHEDPTKRPSFVQIANILRSCLLDVYQQSLGPQVSNPQEQLPPQQIHKASKSSILSSGIEKAKSGIAPLKSCANEIALWKKNPQSPSRTQKQWEWYQEMETGSESNDLLSDAAGFWTRLEAMRASGLLDDSFTQ